MRLPWPDGPYVVPAGTPGAITIFGRLWDGAGDPIPDGLIETWQADPGGRFAHPDDPRGPIPDGDLVFRGFGRAPTGHDRSVTRIYFPDEAELNDADPVLRTVADDRRARLIAVPAGDSLLRFDIHLQGDAETVFFDL